MRGGVTKQHHKIGVRTKKDFGLWKVSELVCQGCGIYAIDNFEANMYLAYSEHLGLTLIWPIQTNLITEWKKIYLWLDY